MKQGPKKESRPEGAALSSPSPWPGVGQAVCRRHRAATHRKVMLIRLKSCGSADTSAGFNEHLSYSECGLSRIVQAPILWADVRDGVKTCPLSNVSFCTQRNQPSSRRCSVHENGSSFGIRASASPAGCLHSRIEDVTSGERNASRRLWRTTLG